MENAGDCGPEFTDVGNDEICGRCGDVLTASSACVKVGPEQGVGIGEKTAVLI